MVGLHCETRVYYVMHGQRVFVGCLASHRCSPEARMTCGSRTSPMPSYEIRHGDHGWWLRSRYCTVQILGTLRVMISTDTYRCEVGNSKDRMD